MKKIVIAAVVLLMCGSQAFAKKSYDEKYREQMLKYVELSGTVNITDKTFDFAMSKYGGLNMSGNEAKIMEAIKKELPTIMVMLLEPGYKKSVSLRDLKRYNRVLRRPAARKFKSAQPEVLRYTAENIKQIGDQVEEYVKKYAAQIYMDDVELDHDLDLYEIEEYVD